MVLLKEVTPSKRKARRLRWSAAKTFSSSGHAISITWCLSWLVWGWPTWCGFGTQRIRNQQLQRRLLGTSSLSLLPS